MKSRAIKPASALSSEFIKPFLKALIKTMDVQCATVATTGKPLPFREDLPNIAIASVLVLESNGCRGTVALAFPENVFLKLCEVMFGEVQTEISDDNRDAAAELLNIVYGLSKVDLNIAGYDFQKAFPQVFMGDAIRLRSDLILPAVQLPVITAIGSFYLRIEFNRIPTPTL